jgi:hypothetical protein
MVGDSRDPAQKAFADLLRGLFHWELDSADKRAYSLDPADCPQLPLFSSAGETRTCYLNGVFWLVYDDATTWRSLSVSFYEFLLLLDSGGHQGSC